MKATIKKLLMMNLVLCALFGGAARSQAQSSTSLILDPNQDWIGYVNVFTLPQNGYAYQFGSAWAPSALTVYYDTPAAPYNTLTIIANTNTYAPGNAYWVNPDGSGNEIVDASYYVQNDSLEGQTLTFSGVCLTNTITPIGTNTTTIFIKEFDNNYNVINSAVVTPTNGPFSLTLATGSGVHIQYGFETVGADANPTNVYNLGEAVYQVQYPPIEPSVVNGQAAVAGQTVSFTETPVGGAPFTYQWMFDGTNLANSSHIAGATGGTLIISNITPADAGMYTVNVTNSNSAGATENATLTVVPFAQAQTNLLIDPSFESGVFSSSSTAGWLNFSGAAILNTSDFYYFSATPVSVYDGTNCLEVYNGGLYDGVYQDRPALPGQVYSANGWFLTPSADPVAGQNVCYIEVQFRDANSDVLMDYQSSQVGANSPLDTWINLQPTNVYNGNFTFVGTSSTIVSPPGTASVRYQITYYTPSGGGGEVDADLQNLRLREPATAFASGAGQVQLTFPTLYAPVYDVLYTTNLANPVWQTLATVPGDGTVHTVSDGTTNAARFYIVNTQ